MTHLYLLMYHYWGTSVSIFSTINKRRVAIRMPLCAFSKKVLVAVGDGGKLIPESRVCMLIAGDGASLFQSREYLCWKLTKNNHWPGFMTSLTCEQHLQENAGIFQVKLFRDPFSSSCSKENIDQPICYIVRWFCGIVMNDLISIPTETSTKSEKQLKNSTNVHLKGSPECSEDYLQGHHTEGLRDVWAMVF